jgi:hypothetical protein
MNPVPRSRLDRLSLADADLYCGDFHSFPNTIRGRERGQAIVPPTAEEYERKAAECLELAQRAKEKWSRAILLEMAQGWIKLARSAKGELPPESDH